MQVTNAAVIQAEYLEKFYYFALRKTGNKQEAEDLAQDIATQALISLMNGSMPKDFASWIWTIARNRYAYWAKEKKRRSITAADEQLIELVPDAAMIEDRLMRQESIALLKRELALLTSDYREITVAYYFQGKKIQEIAARMNLPEGTIKRKLYESRKNMREGFEMAREAGLRSFHADQVSFSKSGPDGKDGSPWRLIERLIPKNILLAAYRNPLTLEELCLELGISMPYMEEEVKLLTEGTLLKEVAKGKFETDFIIVDKTMQREIFDKLTEISVHFCPLIIEYLDAVFEDIQESIGTGLDRSFHYWSFIPMAVDYIVNDIHQMNHIPRSYTKRPHNGMWDIVGYEECQLPFELFVGHNGSGNEQDMMWFYKIRMHNLWARAGELNSFEVAMLAEAIRSNKTIGELGEVEKKLVQQLMERGFLAEHNEEIIPNFMVFKRKQLDQLKHLSRHPHTEQLKSLMNDYYHFTHQTIGRNVPSRLGEQLKFVSGQFLFRLRMMSLRYGLENKIIDLPEHPEKSTVAMYMVMN